MHSEIVVPLVIRDLTEADLPECGWSGSRLHLEHVARELRRDDADYLVACAARSGLPDGSIRRYETTCVLMRKAITRRPATPARPRTAPPAPPPSG